MREKGRKQGNRSKKEGKYPYFVSLVKNREEFQKISRGWGKIFSVAIINTPDIL